jgi:hypothetical protein
VLRIDHGLLIFLRKCAPVLPREVFTSGQRNAAPQLKVWGVHVNHTGAANTDNAASGMK